MLRHNNYNRPPAITPRRLISSRRTQIKNILNSCILHRSQTLFHNNPYTGQLLSQSRIIISNLKRSSRHRFMIIIIRMNNRINNHNINIITTSNIRSIRTIFNRLLNNRLREILPKLRRTTLSAILRINRLRTTITSQTTARLIRR